MNKEQVKPKEIGKLSLLKKLMRFIPFHCSYCGKMYKKCHSEKVNLFMPLPQNGRCCPDGHEGYVIEFLGFAEVKHTFDFVKNPPENEVN